MSQEIVSRSMAGPITDKRAKFTNGEGMRKFAFLNDWASIRIGMHVILDGTATFGGSPVLVLGVCSNDTAGYAAGASTIHFVGASIGGAATTFTYDGTNKLYTPNANYAIHKKVGATVSTAAFGTGAAAKISADRDVARSAIILQITKGSPNFSLSIATPNSAAAGAHNVTDAEFLALMEMSLISDANTIITGYLGGAPGTIAVDEATNGSLNAIDIHWNQSGVPLEISAVRMRKIS
jgi:hypothetical protein